MLGAPPPCIVPPLLAQNPAENQFQSGQVIDVIITINTNHGGRMVMRLCPYPRGSPHLTPECFNALHLRRVAPDNPQHDGTVYWYLRPEDRESTSARFRLPDGLTCSQGCVLQW
jgi:endoglucanase